MSISLKSKIIRTLYEQTARGSVALAAAETDNLRVGLPKALTDQRAATALAHEALAVPMLTFEEGMRCVVST